MTDLEVPYRKVYIESRHRTSGTNSDFTFDLPVTVTYGKNVCAIVQDFSCSASWYSIEADVNDRLYFLERYKTTAGGLILSTLHVVILDEGAYDGHTLAVEIAAKMQAASSQDAISNFQFTAVFVPAKNNILITLTAALVLTHQATFELIADDSLRSMDYWLSSQISGLLTSLPVWSTLDPKSVNNVLGLDSGTLNGDVAFANGRLIATTDLSSSVSTGHVDVRQHNTLLLHSSSFQYNSLGSLGVMTILRRIPVAVALGDVIHNQHSGNPHDNVEVSGMTLQRLHFKLLDARNRNINLRGGNVSFTLVFFEKPL